MTLQVAKVQVSYTAKPERGLDTFIQEAFVHKMPKLVEFVNSSPALLKLAKHLKRTEGSPKTLYQYGVGAWRFTRWLGRTPDEIINECFNRRREPVTRVLGVHASVLDDFVGALQDEGLAPGTVNNHVKGVKQLYRANGLRIELPYRLSKKVKFRDRSPTPEEVQKLVDLGDLRERVIVSLLALGGFRVGTLAQLQYRHVKRDLEKGILPVHVHVEAELTKGKYSDYDTFLAGEAVEYLRLYLDARRKGSPVRISQDRQNKGSMTLPETLTDTSPLIRDGHTGKVRGISPARIHDIVHDLYVKAGLLQNGSGTRYELRAHSLRKYFRTQLASLGVNSDYIDYMMGHVVDSYHDIQMKGVEFLRGVYMASGLGIRPKTQLSKIEMLKEVARAWGVDPEKILTREALASPHRSYVSLLERQEAHAQTLTEALREAVKNDLLKAA